MMNAIKRLWCLYVARKHKWGRAYPDGSVPPAFIKHCSLCKTVAPVKRRTKS